MSHRTVPRWDLAPKLKRPLSLSNPLDYARLLYWAFFFPQAIRWYVEEFGSPDYQEAKGRDVLNAFRYDPIQRRLVIQSLYIMLIGVVGIAGLLQLTGMPINWIVVATFGMVGGVAVGVAGSMGDGVVGGVALGLTFGLAFGVAGGVVSGVVGGVAFIVGGGVALGLAFGVEIGVISGIVGGVVSGVTFMVIGGVALGLAFGVAIGVTLGVAGGVMVGLVVGLAAGVVGGGAFGLAFGVAFSVASSRLFNWLFGWLPARFFNRWGVGGRLVWLPLPCLQTELVEQLTTDWTVGLDHLNQLLAYTLQFIPVVGAFNTALAAGEESNLLNRAAQACRRPHDWDLLRYGSADLQQKLKQQAVRGLPAFIPFFSVKLDQFIEKRFPAELRFDTPARAACAGFWLWHTKDTTRAIHAFEQVAHLPHGFELYHLAQSLDSARQADQPEAIAQWQAGQSWLDNLPEEELRPGALATLRRLQDVARQAQIMQQSPSLLNRSVAANEAGATLTALLKSGADSCPEPEWPLIEEIAAQWRDILSQAGGEVSGEALRRPVDNPFTGYSGLPVLGDGFIGREPILKTIEDHWAAGQINPPLILFGHRRMGKSSILRNLTSNLPTASLLVYLDMQDSGFVDHTGELLLDLAEGIYRAAATAQWAVDPPTAADYKTLGSARRSLNTLLAQVDQNIPAGRRLIIAVDEFEIIQEGIDAGRIDPDVLGYLRAKNQAYPWLSLIFAGLHRLDEMGRAYKSVFYGQAEHIKVGYLPYADFLKLIYPPTLALEYASDLETELYRLTYGQPFLTQRLCWELVHHWNERFLAAGDKTPRVLTPADLAPLLTPDFYHSAGYYFDGVWDNITPLEQALLRAMAPAEDRLWSPQALAAAADLSLEDVDQGATLLKRHDVIVEEAAGVRFASELMRRWIGQFQSDSG